MTFVDPETLLTEGRDRERLYRRLLAASPTFADLITTAQLAGPVRACDATTYAATAPVDPASIKVGEAAFAIDPLSSCGVQTAIQTGLAAAAAVHSILEPDGDTDAALEYYADHQRHLVARHGATAAALYAEHQADAEAAFWRRRSAGAPPPPPSPTPAPLASLLPLRVGLAPAATLQRTPSLVGDRVERRRSLTHPNLDRPVAFLGGSELAPLLDVLQTSPSLADAVSRWERRLPPGRAGEIAAWLCRRGLIETVPA